MVVRVLVRTSRLVDTAMTDCLRSIPTFPIIDFGSYIYRPMFLVKLKTERGA